MNYEFYDTNVIIFLLDEMKKDEEKLRNFLGDRRILVTNRVMGELRVSDSRNLEFEGFAGIFEVYFVNPDRIPEEECGHQHMPGGYPKNFQPIRLESWLVNLIGNGLQNILPNDVEIKNSMFEHYGAKIQNHIGSMNDERELRASINSKIREFGQEAGFDIPLAIISYERFPPKFVFDYVWWLRYSRQNAGTVTANDLYDLLNVTVAPYVSTWVGERSIIGALKNFKGRQIPTTFSSLKYLFQNGRISREVFDSLQVLGDSIKFQEKGLTKTKLVTFSEFTAAYESWS